jgi:hypothetical protein
MPIKIHGFIDEVDDNDDPPPQNICKFQFSSVS